jgi:hypothetical protein
MIRCYGGKVNKPPMMAKRLGLALRWSLCGGNPSDSLSKPQIATVYQIDVELSSSRGLLECTKYGGYMHRRLVDDGLWVLELDMAHHCSP